MRRRRLLLGAGLLVALLLVGMLFVWPALRGDAATPENYERLRVGMTEVEVEAVLGGPADHYGEMAYTGPTSPVPTIQAVWYGERATIYVWLHGGKAVYKDILGPDRERRESHATEKVLRRFRRLLPW